MKVKTHSLVVIPFLVGCYTYTPIDPAAAPVGKEVRARITGAASDRIAPIIQSFNTRELSGNVVENDNGALTLQVQSGAAANTGNTVVPLFQRVPLGRADLVELEQRRLNPHRTVVALGAVAAAVGFGAYAALSSGGHQDEGLPPGDDPPPIIRIPVFRFRF